MITMKCEISAGSEITDAFQEATELANKLNVCIEFKFNDVTCWAKQGGSIRKGVFEWNEALKRGDKYKYASN